ncbi:CDP-glycerol glycerophosphotransferase family protein [Catellatospora tritici]|uniref:CDP-glycerol glycerophosphotransferase family protein n=1 Tax=Catellatospora tritici TaxID=2851566 RepID=UPI001C2D2202|nr:CDP-glycerol glycerophosphotransferase family protein [Catellatospora tritici]MBV1848887.1 CDP-glycerol glycerophosphotransferase family protein [Catellatospora tritici]
MRSVLPKLRRLVRQGFRAVKYLCYRLFLLLPIDPYLAVYTAYWGRGYRCNPAAIYEKARDLAPRVRGVWVVTKEAAATMPEDVSYVVEETLQYFWIMARGAFFIGNVNFADYVLKRRGSVHVQTHHGTPLKLMGVDSFIHAGRKGEGGEELLRRVSRWDFSVAANRHSTEAWSTAYPGTFESLEVGYPRNDILVNASPEHGERVRAALGVAPGQRVILYTPTHRGSTANRFAGHLDVAALAEALGPDTTILLRTHYFYESPAQGPATDSAQVVDVTAYPVVEDLYLAADVLVTDYSSTMFDYAILDRPIVVFASDWEQYRTKRGVYFDIFDQSPGVVVTTQAELVERFLTGSVDDEAARRARTSFRNRFCALEDGRASERIVRRVLLGEQTALAAQPVPAAAATLATQR